MALNPHRIFDTRDGTGGRLGAIGTDETVHVQVTGHGGVPDGALSVALNVTSVNATTGTYFSAFPTGLAVPDSSSLNPQPGRAIPNMVIVGLGAGGAISIFNKAGQADCIIDVLGYFHPTDGCGLEPLVPDRLLDTRVGIGAPAGRVGAGGIVELQVTARWRPRLRCRRRRAQPHVGDAEQRRIPHLLADRPGPAEHLQRQLRTRPGHPEPRAVQGRRRRQGQHLRQQR